MVLVLVSFSASSKAALWLLNAGCGDRVLGFDLRSLLLHMHGSSFVFCLGQRWHCRKARSGLFFLVTKAVACAFRVSNTVGRPGVPVAADRREKASNSREAAFGDRSESADRQRRRKKKKSI